MTTLEDLNFYNRHKLAPWRLVILAVVAFYLAYTFGGIIHCGGMLVCGMSDFGVVLPFYLLLLIFNLRLNLFSYILLYIISSGIYLAVFYYLTGWVEEVYERNKFRARFTLKQI